MNLDLLSTGLSIVIAVIGYFLKSTMETLKDVQKCSIENRSKIDLVENNQLHLADKFDILNSSMRDLTVEIKILNKELAKKKDI